ncbi:MAG: amino acid ABC transporter substrate-binding protein [Candidatus Eremiobacteraeota bacterium]|nr:amino acid ABC transporter substrate-binding protein [Candidatus Eremiobacteraeota bacterium]
MRVLRAYRGVALLLSAAIFACVIGAGTRTLAADNSPIVIGTTVSETGAYSDAGKFALEGYQLYVKEQNAKGGWLGRQLQLKYYDDASDPATSVTLYQKLVQQDKVNLIVGPYSSAVTAAVANIADQYKMPMISPEVAATGPFKRGLKYIFQGTATSDRYVYGAIQIAKAQGYKRVALTGEDTAFPKSIAAAVPDMAKAAGLDLVFNELYPHNASDYTAIVQKIKQANPDVVLAISYFPDSVGILRALKQANVTPKELFFTIGPAEPNFAKEAGNDASGVLFASNWNAELKNPGNQAFAKAFQANFGFAPDYHSAQNYAAMQVLAAAIASAKSLDNEKIRDFMATHQVDTICGTYHVDAGGQQTGYDSLTEQWQNGKQLVVYPSKYSQAKLQLPYQWASK